MHVIQFLAQYLHVVGIHTGWCSSIHEAVQWEPDKTGAVFSVGISVGHTSSSSEGTGSLVVGTWGLLCYSIYPGPLPPRGCVLLLPMRCLQLQTHAVCTPPGVWTWTQSLKVAPVALRGDGLLEVGRRGCSFLCACCGPGSGPPVGLLFWHAQHQLANTHSSDVCTQLTEPLLQASRVLPCLS